MGASFVGVTVTAAALLMSLHVIAELRCIRLGTRPRPPATPPTARRERLSPPVTGPGRDPVTP